MLLGLAYSNVQQFDKAVATLNKAAEAVGYAAFARITGIPALQLRQIEAAELFARSPNAKLVLYGGGTNAIPLVLNGKMLP